MEGIKKYRKIIYVITDFLACVCFNSFFSVRTTDFTNNILAILFLPADICFRTLLSKG